MLGPHVLNWALCLMFPPIKRASRPGFDVIGAEQVLISWKLLTTAIMRRLGLTLGSRRVQIIIKRF